MIVYPKAVILYMSNSIELTIPEYDLTIYPGSVVRIGRFGGTDFRVGYGWYAWGGNRPVCGWYLTNILTQEIKPLQYTDLEDTYLVES